MLKEFLASGTLNLVFAGTVLTSFIFAVISLLGAGLGDAIDFDADADVDADFDFISVSPFALAIFGATFGMTGLITRSWLEMEAIPSILWAVGTGLLVGGVAQVFFIYVLSPSRSSHYSLSRDAVGREVEVITTIPDDGLGEIAYDNVGGRVKLGARSVTGSKIMRGEIVSIERISGRVAQVRPVDKS